MCKSVFRTTYFDFHRNEIVAIPTTILFQENMLQFCDNLEQGGCGHTKKFNPSIVFTFNEKLSKKPSCVSWLNLII
jgi:hypothetical protein